MAEYVPWWKPNKSAADAMWSLPTHLPFMVVIFVITSIWTPSLQTFLWASSLCGTSVAVYVMLHFAFQGIWPPKATSVARLVLLLCAAGAIVCLLYTVFVANPQPQIWITVLMLASIPVTFALDALMRKLRRSPA